MIKHLFLGAVALLLTANLASAIDPGRATGTLKVDGKTFEIKYANIMQYNNEEGFLDKAEIRLVLTDKELPYELLSGPTLDPLLALVRKENVHGVLLKLDQLKPLKNKVKTAQGTLFYPPQDPRASFPFFTISDSNGIFDKLTYGQNRVGGKIRHQFKGDETPFEFDVSFSVPFFEDVVSSKLTGQKALNSPQVKALLAYQKELLQGNFEAAKKMATPERFGLLESYTAQAGKAAVMEMLKSEPGPEILKKLIQAVYVRPFGSYIVIKDKTGRSIQRLIQVGKAWLVD